MIGLDQILEVRKNGVTPEAINVWVGKDSDPHYEGVWHKYSDTQKYPAVLIEPKDNLDSFDFRGMFGLVVFIRGDNSNRMLKVFEKILKF